VYTDGVRAERMQVDVEPGRHSGFPIP
jgi:hypothetical protein